MLKKIVPIYEETGACNWTDDMLARAIREGISFVKNESLLSRLTTFLTFEIGLVPTKKERLLG